VYADFKERQRQGEFEGVDDYRVWRALSHYVPQSADRIKTLATVAGVYGSDKVARFTKLYGEWGFGYYARTWRYEEIEQEAIFEYLAAVYAGDFPKVGVRRLGVGEFIMSYEYNVRHLQVERPRCPENFPAGSLFDRGLPFKAVYDAFKMLRKNLGRYVYNPKVKRFMDRTEEMERELAELMVEIGVDSEVENSVR
jgi:hypothetical protein